MAEKPAAAQPAAAKKDPAYTVCEVEEGTGKLIVLELSETAKNQEKAMEQVDARLTEKPEGAQLLAAFLAGSLRTKRFRKKRTVVSESEAVEVSKKLFSPPEVTRAE